MQTFGFQNIINGNGFLISLTGMFIVFCGLVIISLAIALLPRILAIIVPEPIVVKSSEGSKQVENSPVVDPRENDIGCLISLILQLEHEKYVLAKSEENKATVSEGKSGERPVIPIQGAAYA